MTKLFGKSLFVLILFLLLYACSNKLHNVDDVTLPDLSKAIITTTPESVSLNIDTSTANLSHPVQSVTFTNIGHQPATGFSIKGFKDESAPLYQSSTCDSDLAAGASCMVKIRLSSNHKIASSGPISRSTIIEYEYNNGARKVKASLPVTFSLEKWIASLFITEDSVTGHIAYQLPDEVPYLRDGVDSADRYCKTDKNNPKNGYDYKALIYDTTSRTPYLDWVLIGGQVYFSVMAGVYHQKVWQTSYKQGTANNLLSNVYNCIGVNCLAMPVGDDEAWTGIKLDNSSLSSTCGGAGSAWKSNVNSDVAVVFGIKPKTAKHSVIMENHGISCGMQKRLICVSM